MIQRLLYRKSVFRIGSLVAFLVVWEAYGRRLDRPTLFAPFSEVFAQLIALLRTADFWTAAADTATAFAIGLVAAIVVGVLLGITMGYFPVFGRFMEVYLRWILAIPLSAVVPVIVLAAGIGLHARALVVFLMAVVEVAINAYVGVLQVDRRHVEMARSFGASSAQMMRTVVLPGSLPGVLGGIRLGTGRALIGMVLAELLLASTGLGRLISRFQAQLRAAELLAVVLFLLVFAAVAMQLVEAAESRLLRNHR